MTRVTRRAPERGERSERQVSRQLPRTGSTPPSGNSGAVGERQVVTVNRNGRILKIQRPPPGLRRRPPFLPSRRIQRPANQIIRPKQRSDSVASFATLPPTVQGGHTVPNNAHVHVLKDNQPRLPNHNRNLPSASPQLSTIPQHRRGIGTTRNPFFGNAFVIGNDATAAPRPLLGPSHTASRVSPQEATSLVQGGRGQGGPRQAAAFSSTVAHSRVPPLPRFRLNGAGPSAKQHIFLKGRRGSPHPAAPITQHRFLRPNTRFRIDRPVNGTSASNGPTLVPATNFSPTPRVFESRPQQAEVAPATPPNPEFLAKPSSESAQEDPEQQFVSNRSPERERPPTKPTSLISVAPFRSFRPRQPNREGDFVPNDFFNTLSPPPTTESLTSTTSTRFTPPSAFGGFTSSESFSLTPSSITVDGFFVKSSARTRPVSSARTQTGNQTPLSSINTHNRTPPPSSTTRNRTPPSPSEPSNRTPPSSSETSNRTLTSSKITRERSQLSSSENSFKTPELLSTGSRGSPPMPDTAPSVLSSKEEQNTTTKSSSKKSRLTTTKSHRHHHNRHHPGLHTSTKKLSTKSSRPTSPSRLVTRPLSTQPATTSTRRPSSQSTTPPVSEDLSASSSSGSQRPHSQTAVLPSSIFTQTPVPTPSRDTSPTPPGSSAPTESLESRSSVTTATTARTTTFQTAPTATTQAFTQQTQALGTTLTSKRPSSSSSSSTSSTASSSSASSAASSTTTRGQMSVEDLSHNSIGGPQAPSPQFNVPLPVNASPPGEMPPSDNVVHMLNGAEDFMEMARKLNLVRSRRLLRRRRRMAEYETSSYEMGERWDSNQYEISSSDERFMN